MGTAHDRRRTCAISMQKIGVIPTAIDAVLNHKVSRGGAQTISVTATTRRWPMLSINKTSVGVAAEQYCRAGHMVLFIIP